MELQDPFCDEGIYRQVFYESDKFIVVYNIHPILPGHSLIISKRHVLQMTELNEEEFIDFAKVLKTVIPKLLKVYGADSYNLSVNSGEKSGAKVFHFHMHIVPRGRVKNFLEGNSEFYETLEEEKSIFKSDSNDIERNLQLLRKAFKYSQKRK